MAQVWMRDPKDSRDPRIVWDHKGSPYAPPRDAVPRDEIFRNHNCSRCNSGVQACVEGAASRCGWPHARND